MRIETHDMQRKPIGGASHLSRGLHRGFFIFLYAALVLLSAGLIWAASTKGQSHSKPRHLRVSKGSASLFDANHNTA